jgi:hypothetical protein
VADGAVAAENADVADGADGVGVPDGGDEIPAFHGGDNTDDVHAGSARDDNAREDDVVAVAAAVDDAPEAVEATVDVAD